MKCEFRKGDIIVQIGKDVSYIVSDAHTSIYALMCLDPRGRNGLVHTILDKNYIDEHYIKVDRCNLNNYSDIVDKLKALWYNIHKGEETNGRQL